MSTLIHPTAIVEPGALLEDGVTIGPMSVVHSSVRIGAGSQIGSHCVLGYTEPGQEQLPLLVGAGSRIRSHSVFYGGSQFGPGLTTGHRVTVREGTIAGEGLQIGTLSDLQGRQHYGRYVRLHSNVHIGQLSSIGDFVWIFPYVVLTNDPHPPSDGMLRGVRVGRYSAIATMAVILPGVSIGQDCLVGAGSVVRSDTGDGRIVVGNPAKDVGPVTRIQLSDGSGPAYPWRRHFHRGYPEDVTAEWRREFE
jgi:acetyltransferase-like isoleucine patch superfamily enzyme